jgi:BCD family chlorophyll transporter-like MFS transporter
MSTLGIRSVAAWQRVGTRFLPFADAASAELPLSRLLRLSLFQLSAGITVALLNGTLNRIMIVELGVSAWLVAAMISLPLVAAPFRALLGFKSDTHRSVLGWRRVPYIWFGTLLQFGGLAIMPFALMLLSGRGTGPTEVGYVGAALSFLLVGAGFHTAQTAGLALATDLAPEHSRPRVVALLYVMLLLGMVAGSSALGMLLADFSNLRLVQVIQGTAQLTLVLNLIALWKQEARRPQLTDPARERPTFSQTWSEFRASGRSMRLLVAVGLGATAFSMQDILLEPYGGQVLHLTVGATSLLTALSAGGSLVAFSIAARWLGRGGDAHRLAGYGVLIGIVAFAAIILSNPVDSPTLFRAGTLVLGFGNGLFAVGTLIAAMNLEVGGHTGLALGAWGAVQATCAGAGIALGGAMRDLFGQVAGHGALGAGLTGPASGYVLVYSIEIVLLLAALIAVGPLAKLSRDVSPQWRSGLGLADFPG